MRVRIEKREQMRPKWWKKYLRYYQNKSEFVKFLLEDWSQPMRYAHLFTPATIFFFFFFFNCGSQFSKLSLKDGLTEWLSTLVRDQEETETKLFLCTKHAEVLEVLVDITIYALYCALQILHSFLYISRLVQVTGGIA